MIAEAALIEPPAQFLGHRTAQRAVDILLEADPSYCCPTRAERDALLVGYAKHRKVLYGAAFDALRLDRPVDLLDPDAIAGSIDAITICEVKSTNRTAIKTDLKGYFFNITAAELLTAQSVGERYRFVFVNTLTGEHHAAATRGRPRRPPAATGRVGGAATFCDSRGTGCTERRSRGGSWAEAAPKGAGGGAPSNRAASAAPNDVDLA